MGVAVWVSDAQGVTLQCRGVVPDNLIQKPNKLIEKV